MSSYKFIRKNRNQFAGDQLPSRILKIKNPSDIEILTLEITIFLFQGYTNHQTLLKPILLLRAVGSFFIVEGRRKGWRNGASKSVRHHGSLVKKNLTKAVP